MRENKKLSQYTPEEIRRLIRETLSGQKEISEQVKEKDSSIKKEKSIPCKERHDIKEATNIPSEKPS